MQPSTALAPQPAAIAPPVRGLPAPPQLGAERIAPLDAARALGVLAMVFGHTCDALLSAAVRAGPLAREYWKVRGLTAPLFLMVSGWAVAVAVERSRARGLPVVRQRLPRVLLLFAIGYALRYPGWDLPGFFSGRPAVWEHVLAFDALHAIAVGLFLASLVFALPSGAGRAACSSSRSPRCRPAWRSSPRRRPAWRSPGVCRRWPSPRRSAAARRSSRPGPPTSSPVRPSRSWAAPPTPAAPCAWPVWARSW